MFSILEVSCHRIFCVRKGTLRINVKANVGICEGDLCDLACATSIHLSNIATRLHFTHLPTLHLPEPAERSRPSVPV